MGTFAVKTPDGEVRLVDLSFNELADLEAASKQRWPVLLSSPAITAQSAQAVYEAACKKVDVEPEELTPARLITDDIFYEVEDDKPTLYEDGGLPDPKAEGETQTAG